MEQNESAPAAVLWDMDGTLIDTEPYWIEAEVELCAAHGAAWTHADGLTLVGNPLTVSALCLQERGVRLTVPEIIDVLQTQVTASVRRHVPWQHDARALLDRMVARGIPCGLVTMSYAMLAGALLEHADVFDAVVTGEIVANGKPHPEPFLRAAEMLGVPIERCLAIEDSPSGIRSAHASGARTVAVRWLTPLEPLPTMSRVTSLDLLTDEAIAAIMGGAVLDDLDDET